MSTTLSSRKPLQRRAAPRFSTRQKRFNELELIGVITALVLALLCVYYGWVFHFHAHHSFP